MPTTFSTCRYSSLNGLLSRHTLAFLHHCRLQRFAQMKKQLDSLDRGTVRQVDSACKEIARNCELLIIVKQDLDAIYKTTRQTCSCVCMFASMAPQPAETAEWWVHCIEQGRAQLLAGDICCHRTAAILNTRRQYMSSCCCDHTRQP